MKAAITSLKLIEDLFVPPDVAWTPDMDMLDWLGGFFGFQVYTMALGELSPKGSVLMLINIFFTLELNYQQYIILYKLIVELKF